MSYLTSEFHAQAWRFKKGHAAGSVSDTEAEGMGVLTLDMADSPYADLLKKIEKLLDTGLLEDMKQAMELARTAIAENIFDSEQNLELSEKLGHIIDRIHTERELGRAFTRSNLDVATPEQTLPALATPASTLDLKTAGAYTR